MKKTALVVVIIAAIAMMVGAQGVLAAKPTTPVTGIANGKVTNFGGNPADWPPVPPALGSVASGPWKVVVHDPTGTPIVNFTATSQVAGVVWKVSYNGPGTLTEASGVVTIIVPSIEVKSAGTIWPWDTSRIVIDSTSMTLDITDNGVINLVGNTKLFKVVP